jgi:hypothetical protein
LGEEYQCEKDRPTGMSDRGERVFGILHTPAIALDGVGVVSQG